MVVALASGSFPRTWSVGQVQCRLDFLSGLFSHDTTKVRACPPGFMREWGGWIAGGRASFRAFFRCI